MKPFQSMAELWASGLVDRAEIELLIDVVESEKAAEKAWPAIEETLREVEPAEWWTLAGEAIPCTWGTAVTAARRSFTAASVSAREAGWYAHLAWPLAEGLTDLEISKESWRQELTAYVHAAAGNALRVMGSRLLACSAFNGAFEALGPIDQPPSWLPFRVEVLSSAANLMLDFGSLEDALDLIERAEAAAPHVRFQSPRNLALRLALQRARALSEWNRPGEAEAALDEARWKVTGWTPKPLRLAYLHALVVLRLAQGRVEAAEAALQEIRRLLGDAADPAEELRAAWLEARLYRARGRRAEAEGLLMHVQQQLLAREQGLDAALATAELSLLLAEGGDTAGAASQVLAAERPLEGLRLDRETKGALRLAWDAAREAELEPVGLEVLMEQLERVHRRYGR